MYIVYKHINKVNGKVYVGQTRHNNPYVRWKRNGSGYKNGIFKLAIKKYGWDSFDHIIVRSDLSKSEANELERQLIKEYKELNLSYNITDGGEGTQGFRFSEEIKKRMSSQRKGKKFPEHLKAEVSARFKGKPFTEDHKNKISKALRGVPKSEEAKIKMKSNHNYHDLVVVLKFSREGNFICKYPSIAEASRDVGIPATNISRCARGKRPTAGGFIWKYNETT